MLLWIAALSPLAAVAWSLLQGFAAFSWDGVQSALLAAGETLGLSCHGKNTGCIAGQPLFAIDHMQTAWQIFFAQGRPSQDRPLYGTARILFFCLSLAGLGASFTHFAKAVDKVVEGRFFSYPNNDKALEDTIMVRAARAAAQENFDQEITQALRLVTSSAPAPSSPPLTYSTQALRRMYAANMNRRQAWRSHPPWRAVRKRRVLPHRRHHHRDCMQLCHGLHITWGPA